MPVLGDALNEADETFVVKLTNPANGVLAGTGQATATITDDDPLPSLAINDVTMTEGDSGTKSFTFTVKLSAPSGRAVTVAFGTADLTATAGVDYQSRNGTLTFNPGVTSLTVTIVVNCDRVPELDESFALDLSAPVNATIADGLGLGTILNDDSVA